MAKTPEGAFVIPFSFYEKHVLASGAQSIINKLLSNPTSNEKSELLIQIQEKIKNHPLNKKLDSVVTQQILTTVGDEKMRFRSSTNAEDIKIFNGAGLYHSQTGKPTSTKKPIDLAIKNVWASLWFERAFDERDRFNINQNNIAMGILVHRSFPNETANGVAISKNIYRSNYPGFTISVQKGEESVVKPDSGIICDHFLGYLNKNINYSKMSVMIDWISKSSFNKGKPVLSNNQLIQLLETIDTIKEYYMHKGFYFERNTNEYGLDIEFKFDGNNNDLYIKQVRYFNN